MNAHNLDPSLPEDERRQRLAALVESGTVSAGTAARIQFREVSEKAAAYGKAVARQNRAAMSEVFEMQRRADGETDPFRKAALNNVIETLLREAAADPSGDSRSLSPAARMA